MKGELVLRDFYPSTTILWLERYLPRELARKILKIQRRHRLWKRCANMEFLLLEKHFIQLHPQRCSLRQECYHYYTAIGEYIFHPPRITRRGNQVQTLILLKLKNKNLLLLK